MSTIGPTSEPCSGSPGRRYTPHRRCLAHRRSPPSSRPWRPSWNTVGADHDPLLGDTPSDRSSWRTATSYRQLVRHAGHAKLWRALLAHERPPRYKAIALATGLSVNTIRNYRDDLKSELRRHGVTDPTMREMHRFAHLARPLLEPILHQRNPGSSGDA